MRWDINNGGGESVLAKDRRAKIIETKRKSNRFEDDKKGLSRYFRKWV